MWVALAGYISIVMLSTAVPGAQLWAQPPAVFEEVFQVRRRWIKELTHTITGLPSTVINAVIGQGQTTVACHVGVWLGRHHK